MPVRPCVCVRARARPSACVVMFGGFVNSIYIVITCTGTACWSFMIIFFPGCIWDYFFCFKVVFGGGGGSGRHITHLNSCLLVAIHFLSLANKTKNKKKHSRTLFMAWRAWSVLPLLSIHCCSGETFLLSAVSMFILHQTNKKKKERMWVMHVLIDEPFKPKGSLYLPVWVQNCPASERTGPP